MINMRTALLVMIITASYPVLAQVPTDSSGLRGHIPELEMAHANAIFKSDAAALDTLMDDEVTVNQPANRILKERD